MRTQCRKETLYVLFGLALLALGYVVYSETASGGFTQWSKWSLCSKSCGEGVRARYRECTAPRPGMIGKDCQGTSNIREKCFILEHCPIDGGFTEWSGYGECDKKCGGGTKVRIRRCANPSPEYGGKSCEGSATEKMDCNVHPCPINGGYSAWGAFSKCEITGKNNCGKGKHVRTRTCNNPVPQHGGKKCEGPDSETAECEIPCPTTSPPLNTTSTNSTKVAITKAKVS